MRLNDQLGIDDVGRVLDQRVPGVLGVFGRYLHNGFQDFLLVCHHGLVLVCPVG